MLTLCMESLKKASIPVTITGSAAASSLQAIVDGGPGGLHNCSYG
jgi:hypothetical protein